MARGPSECASRPRVCCFTIAAGIIVSPCDAPGGADGSHPFIALGTFPGSCSAATGLTLRKLGSLGEHISSRHLFAIGASRPGDRHVQSLNSTEYALSLFTEPVDATHRAQQRDGIQHAQTQGWASGNRFFSASPTILARCRLPSLLVVWAITSAIPRRRSLAGIALITARSSPPVSSVPAQ